MRKREVVELGSVAIDLIAEGAGTPLVLLPSKARCSEDFDAVAGGLAQAGFRVLRPQPRGAHASKGPEAGLRLEHLASDVGHLIAREQAGPAIVVGHAFGNWPARMLAVTHPHLVRGVVLAAAAARVTAGEQRADVRTAGDVSRPDVDRLAALGRSFFAPGHDPSSWLGGWHAEAGRLQDIATAATPREAYWHAGSAPLLDLVPEHDPFKPRAVWQETRLELGARATVMIVPGASHALFPEQPALVIDAISAWARQLGTE